MIRRLLIILVSVAAIVGCSQNAQSPEPRPLTLTERLQASTDFQLFSARGVNPDLTTLSIHQLGNDRSVAVLEAPNYGSVAFVFRGDTTTVASFFGYGVKLSRQALGISIRLETPAQDRAITLNYDADYRFRDIGLAQSPIGSTNAYWDAVFDCVIKRAADLPTWLDLTYGVSLALCVTGNPAGCFAAGIGTAIYIGPCLLTP